MYHSAVGRCRPGRSEASLYGASTLSRWPPRATGGPATHLDFATLGGRSFSLPMFGRASPISDMHVGRMKCARRRVYTMCPVGDNGALTASQCVPWCCWWFTDRLAASPGCSPAEYHFGTNWINIRGASVLFHLFFKYSGTITAQIFLFCIFLGITF